MGHFHGCHENSVLCYMMSAFNIIEKLTLQSVSFLKVTLLKLSHGLYKDVYLPPDSKHV